MRALLLSIALAAALPAHAGDATQDRVLSYYLSVRVDVDAQGHVLKAAAPVDFPQAVRDYVERRVSTWQYQPARQDGVPVPATTYVRVGMCALPVAEGYRLGLDFKGNGPGIVTDGPWFMPPPNFPVDLIRRGAEGAFRVSWSIQTDGTPKVTAIEALEGTKHRYENAFRDALTKWIEGLRYQPELVNGRPVPTVMQLTEVRFLVNSESTPSPKQQRTDLVNRALASSECREAAAPGDLISAMVQNSTVKVTPEPAG